MSRRDQHLTVPGGLEWDGQNRVPAAPAADLSA